MNYYKIESCIFIMQGCFCVTYGCRGIEPYYLEITSDVWQ